MANSNATGLGCRAAAIGLAFIGLITARESAADIVRINGADQRAQVTAFDRTTVLYTAACGGSETRSAAWKDIASITFEPTCGALPFAGADNEQSCSEGSIDVFAVTLAQDNVVIAESVTMTANRTVHLDIFKPWEQAHGPIADVRKIARKTICRNSIPENYVTPSSFCHEGRQVAVAFDYQHPVSNKILTNGFSFFIRSNGTPPADFDAEAFGETVRASFQTGLSLWMIALDGAKPRLPAALQNFLAKRTSSSPGGYTMFLPPQVIRLHCPQSATFIVELSFGDLDLFPTFPLSVARARFEGRTIALNMNLKLFKCYGSDFHVDAMKRLRYELENGCTNLVPIMAHELGHAFGLNHADEPRAHSLMDSRLSADALSPTPRDVDVFTAVLQQSIEGAEPGALKFVSSVGVQPPVDWIPWNERQQDRK